MRVIFLGPPGAGKGTQARFVREGYNACLLSTGDILRKAAEERTKLGKKAAAYMTGGKLVPDDLMLNMVAERLREEDCRAGFILDGFPRTIVQADGLDGVLRDLGARLDCVFFLHIPREVIIERLAERRTCKRCGSMYHPVFNPSRRPGACDQCGGELYQREDDREETIEERLRVYGSETAPLMDYYRRQGLLREIDGFGGVEEIRGRVLRALKETGV